ncbi:MAG TPA: SRPBCC domain-containing protein [Caulobacteraceae bacterium]|jgi:hypothetical protein|nr:SRPBCC domain-containing protein [Caulobacteraceae bacterium]
MPIKIEHRIGVRAPASAIWPMIMDVPGWAHWNPLYPKAEGVIAFESRLTLEVAIPGEPPRTIQPVVVDWTPEEQIIWKVRMMGGFLRTTRYIEIETLTDGGMGVIFSNGEIFEGAATRLLDRRRRARIKAGFTAFGEAVRDRAEAEWRRSGGATTLSPA